MAVRPTCSLVYAPMFGLSFSAAIPSNDQDIWCISLDLRELRIHGLYIVCWSIGINIPFAMTHRNHHQSLFQNKEKSLKKSVSECAESTLAPASGGTWLWYSSGHFSEMSSPSNMDSSKTSSSWWYACLGQRWVHWLWNHERFVPTFWSTISWAAGNTVIGIES